MRLDLELIKPWIKPGCRLLDLGCGDGTLLQMLRDEKQIDGLGIEINPEHLTACIARGLSVVEQDIDQSLANFRDDSFDMVVMTHALQMLHNPHLALDEMLRIGRECIVTFPNFGHWQCRWHLSRHGRMPVSEFLPYSWYDTPNIHFCTVNDFEQLCSQKDISILNRKVVASNNQSGGIAERWPNLFALTAVYHISK